MKKLIPLFLICTLSLVAQKGILKTTTPNRAAIQTWQQFDGNRINATINSAGPFADYLKTNYAGLEWPKGSGKTAVYSAGIWITGKHRASDSLRTAAQIYSTEYQPGPILTTYNTATNDSTAAGNPHDQRYRVYKINKEDNEITNNDYAEWPGDLGAPFIDINNNGVWDKGTDIPKLTGDQTVWTVYNDLDKTAHSRVGLTPPMGIEVQASYFGYDKISYLQDIMFMKWRIINKSDAVYDSVHFSIWSDTDMGVANDDVIGTDSILHLIYTYNGDEFDGGSNGYGTPPPANGFTILQGPAVPGTQKDSVFINGRFVRGIKSLRSTSAISFLENSEYTSDPVLRSPHFARTAFYLQNGLKSFGTPIISPFTGNPTKYMVSGDPVTETGWTEKYWGLSPGDRRSMISAGPFTLAAGDTQELYGAFVMARGKDRLNSISELRTAVKAAQSMHQFGYPPAPFITIDTVGMTETHVTLHCSAVFEGIPAAYGKLYVFSPDTLGYLSKYFIFDDGTNGDITANDKKYSTTITIPRTASPYKIDLTLYGNGINDRWNSILKFSTVKVHPLLPVIYSDNLNNDGKVNAGETVRFGISLQNENRFRHTGLVLASTANSLSSSLHYAELQPNETVSIPYDPENPASYISFSLPLHYSDDHYTLSVTISDSLGNFWQDSVVFPVTKIQMDVPIVQRVNGSGNASFEIVVTDQSKIKNHQYVIFGIDSAGRPSCSMFGVKDSSTGSVLLSHIPASMAFNQSQTIPEIDGFKIFINSIVKGVTISEAYHDTSVQWVTTTASIDTAGTVSTLHYGTIPDIEFRFSKKLGYSDINSNGKYDLGEPYIVDSLNTERSQRAYFYRQVSGLPSSMHFVGYIMVPFSVFEHSAGTTRQLAVVIIDKDKNNQWDIYAQVTAMNNNVLVFNDTYNPAGTQYDSSKGGIDLSRSLSSNLPIPTMYRITFGPVTGTEPYSTHSTLEIKNSHPFSAQDVVVFNPTVLTNVRTAPDVPTSFTLEQNFPNPFNPSTTIRFAVPKRTQVTLTVYNTLGQRVATLVNEAKNEGFYAIRWNGRSDQGFSVASGMYFYHITAGNFTASRKMLLIK